MMASLFAHQAQTGEAVPGKAGALGLVCFQGLPSTAAPHGLGPVDLTKSQIQCA